MLFYLFQLLATDYRGFGVFQYITLRGVLATLTALGISFIVGPAFIAWLKKYQIGQTVRTDGPQTHLSKSGTPTMGGGLILVAVALATLLWADLSNRFVLISLGTTLAFGVIGWIDDYRKLVLKDPKGLAARYKYLGQSIVALIAAIILYATAEHRVETQLILPFIKNV